MKLEGPADRFNLIYIIYRTANLCWCWNETHCFNGSQLSGKNIINMKTGVNKDK